MPQFEITNSSTSKTTTSANYVTLPTLTQTEITALTGVVEGSKVFNSTTSKEQLFVGGIWEDIVVGTIPSPTVNVFSVSADTTLVYGAIYKTDATTLSITHTLPTAVGNAGKEVSVQKTDNTANTVSVQGTGIETINGDTTAIISFQNTFITFISDGSNFILS